MCQKGVAKKKNEENKKKFSFCYYCDVFSHHFHSFQFPKSKLLKWYHHESVGARTCHPRRYDSPQQQLHRPLQGERREREREKRERQREESTQKKKLGQRTLNERRKERSKKQERKNLPAGPRSRRRED